MSCNTCQSKFSLFNRENGCPSCGFSYCGKCLKYRYNLPNIGAKKICGRCYNTLSAANDSQSPVTAADKTTMEDVEALAPIDITQKLDLLENPAKPPIVMYKQEQHWDSLKRGLEPADQEIVERLRKLKGKDKNLPSPSIDEIKRRLALLKDQDPEATSTNLPQVDVRTDEEKTEDLIKEYLERLEVASSSDPCQEIEARLNSLRGNKNNPERVKTTDEDDEDENVVTKKLIKKALAEAELERKYGDVDELQDELEDMEVQNTAVSSDDEAPSCVMCDQTSDLVRCLSCTGDLYCPLCFEDNHDEFEMRRHKTVPAKQSDS